MIKERFIPLSRPDITEDELSAVVEVLKSGWLTTGPKVTEFEDAVVNYLREGAELFAVGLNSCTAGLHLSLLARNIGKGDEVIVPTWTFAATAQVVEWVGAKPIFCDIEETTLNIDLQKAESLINRKTKAIIPVHMGGYPCDMDSLNVLAEQYNLSVIEDAAHAIGTEYNGSKIGNFSDLTVFSFYATKNLAMGEGGLVVSKNKELIEKIRKLSYFGINKEAFQRYAKTGMWQYDIEELGFKYNLDSVHAAIGIAQLKRLDIMNERRRRIAERYKKNLDHRFIFPPNSTKHKHIYHLFLLRVPPTLFNRDTLIQELKNRNIGTGVHFIPLHLHSYYKHFFPNEQFPVANRIFLDVISIPMFPSMLDEDIDYVINTLNALIGDSHGQL